MDISKLFEKFNIPEKFNFDKNTPIQNIVLNIGIVATFILPAIYIFLDYSWKVYGIIGTILAYIIGVVGVALIFFILYGLFFAFSKKYNWEDDFFPDKMLLLRNKKDILSHISESPNISSIYPYLKLNLKSIAYSIKNNEMVLSDKEKNNYINQEAISLLKEISALIKEKRILPNLNNDSLESILNHYKDFFLMSESNREILGLELESGEVFPKLSEVLDFIKKQDLNFNDFLFFRNQIVSCSSLINLFYEDFIVTHLEKSGTTYLKENLEEYQNYLSLIAEIKNDDGTLRLTNELSYAIEPIYNILNKYPDFLKTNDLISLYTYQVNYKHLELLFEDERFNFHDKAELSFSFIWNYDSMIKVRNLIVKCQNIDTLNQLNSNNKVIEQFALITAIISHPLMRDNDYSKLLNSLINVNWDNYSALEYLVSTKLSQDLGENIYRQVQSRITELKRDERLLQNSEEVKNSQIRTQQMAEEQAHYAREQAESQRRQEQYQRVQAENSRIAAQNSQVAAQNSRVAAQSAQQAQRDAHQAKRNTERSNNNPFNI